MGTAEQLTYQLVVAATRKLGIGKAGTMPWRLPRDLAYFKELTSKTVDPTKQNVVIMGRKTWESIPPKFRPLPGRINVVLTRARASDENNGRIGNGPELDVHSQEVEGVHYSSSLKAVMELLGQPEMQGSIEQVFVIGGGQVYRWALVVYGTHVGSLSQRTTGVQVGCFHSPIQAVWKLFGKT
jgi:dihydrofolate reductase